MGFALGGRGSLVVDISRVRIRGRTYVLGVGASGWGWVATLLVSLAWGVPWDTCSRLVLLISRLRVTVRGSCQDGA